MVTRTRQAQHTHTAIAHAQAVDAHKQLSLSVHDFDAYMNYICTRTRSSEKAAAKKVAVAKKAAPGN